MQPGKSDLDIDQDLTQIVRVGGRCSYVLLALLLLILIYPYLIELTWGRIIIGILVSTIVVVIAYAVGRSGRRLVAGSAFALLFLGLQWTYLATGNPLIFGSGVVVLLLFMTYAMGELFAYLMRHGPVTGDKLHAALAIYILGAFFWAALYTLLEHISSGSFLVNSGSHNLLDFYDMLYFSFTTLTSTGYGDITPATRRAESLAMLEQIAGVFYVAVLIARLAGLYPPGDTSREPTTEQAKPRGEPCAEIDRRGQSSPDRLMGRAQ